MGASADTPSESKRDRRLIDLDTSRPIWDRFFVVAPLVLIGTVEEDGSDDFAPKHMVTPMGWQNYFGFVCSRQHGTCGNIERKGVFTVSFPKPSQILYSSLAASPRVDDHKPVLAAFDTRPARSVPGKVIEDAGIYFECRKFIIVDGFGDNCLVTGEIVEAYADADYVRVTDQSDQERLLHAPLLAYVSPGRFASVAETNAFPFPADMKK